MRHGDAESLKKSDITRNLTSFGLQQSEEAGRWLNQYYSASNGIEMALVSPYLRARQTFEQLNLHVQVENMHIDDGIIPDGNPKLAHDHIDFLVEENKLTRNLLIVSHMPFVSYLLDELLTNKMSLLFATSSLVIIDYSRFKLVEVYHPTF